MAHAAQAWPKPHKDRGMEGMVARWYAANTGKTLDEVTALARRIASRLPPAASVLDIASGPGYFSIELAKLGAFSITGLDISRTFVDMATATAAQAGVHVDFQQGNASNMPFAAGTFDFLICRAAFKNFAQPVVALREMRRVLKPGGRGLIIDLRGDASPESVDQAVDGMRLNALNRLWTRLAFRFMLLKSAYTKAQFQQMAAEAGFKKVEIEEIDIGLEVQLTN